MTIKLNEASVEKVIAAGANHWVKGDFDRYYIDVKDLVDYDFYKSGNVSYAAINGEKISNTKGTELLYTKIYVENNELVSGNEELIELAMEKYDLHEESEKSETTSEPVAVEEVQASNTDDFKVLDSYLEAQSITRYQISKITGISPTTLQRATDKCATDIHPRVAISIAEALKKTVGQVYDELIEMESENNMTTEETKLLLINTLDNADAIALVTTEDMGDKTAIIAEIDLPSGETIRFSVNNPDDDAITRYNVLNDLAYAMDDYDHEEDGEFYPTQYDSDQPVYAEYMGISKTDADYLSELSDKIFKARRG